MSQRDGVTTSTKEATIGELLSGRNVLSVPYFQRPYKWRKERLGQFQQDILSLVAGESDYHFFGAIILNGRAGPATDGQLHELIDGQQRLTTVFLHIASAIEILCEVKRFSYASELCRNYLIVKGTTALESNMKLHSCRDDRVQINSVVRNLLQYDALASRLGRFELKELPPTGHSNGQLAKNYKAAAQFMRAQYKSGGIRRIKSICDAILHKVTVVNINIENPADGPRIFDALNSRQEPMTIGDLVRNEIFRRVPDKQADRINRLNWHPFYRRFSEGKRSLFDAYFFPYGLTQNPNLKKAEVYPSLRAKWSREKDPVAIIAKLSKYQRAFLDLAAGTNDQGHSVRIAKLFRNFAELGGPSVTYPFMMQLSEAIREGKISSSRAAGVLEVIESFLVRRAICGHEPTGLHAVFKRLWVDCRGQPTKENVKRKIRSHRTVTWPSDKDVVEAIKTRALYQSGITKYLILQYDASLGGDTPTDIAWIEHVLPVTPGAAWTRDFTRKQFEESRDLLANLIPLTSRMNRQLGNRAYAVKRKIYRADSLYKCAREFANKFKTWTPADLRRRSSTLATWVKRRWPH